MRTSRAATATTWSAVSVAVTSVGQLAMMLVLARVLAPEQMGLVSTVLVFSSFLEIFVGLGLTAALIQRRGVTSWERASVHAANVLLALLGFAAVAALCGPIASLFGAPAAAPLIVVCAAAFVLTSAGQASRAALEKRLDFRPLGIADAVFALTSFSTSVALAVAGAGAMSAAIGLVLAAGARTTVFIVAARRIAPLRLHLRLAETRRFFGYGVWQSADGVLNYIGNTLATIATGFFVSTVALGGFNLAFTIGVSLAGRISPVLTRVLFPYFAIIQDEKDRVRTAYLRLLTLVGLLNIPVLACLSLIANDVMTLVYGERWASFGGVLAVLALAGAIRSLGYPVGSLLAGTDRLRLGVALNAARTVVNIPLILVMTSVWGIDGAAWSLVVMALVSYVLGYVCLTRVVPTSLRAYLSATVAPLVVAAPPVVAVALTGWALETAPVPLRLPAQVLAGLLSFVVAVLCSRDGTVSLLVHETRARLARPRRLDIAVVLPADERFDGTGGAVASWVRNAYARVGDRAAVGVFCPRGGAPFSHAVSRVGLAVFDPLDAIVRSLARAAGTLLRRNPDGIVRVLTRSGRLWIWWIAPLLRDAAVAHVHNEPAYAVALRRAGYRGRIVLHLHNDPVDGVRRATSGSWRGVSAAQIREAVDVWVFCSEHLARLARQRLGIAETVVIPNGATVPDARPSWHPVGDPLRVAFAGRLVPEKGAVEAAEAVRVLAGRRPVVFDVYGGKAPGAAVGESPYTHRLRAVAAEVEAAAPHARVRIRGFVPPDVMTSELADADVFLYPCRWEEPFGMVLLDAMVVGTPVVSVRRGGIPEIVGPEGGGELLDAAPTAEELADAVERVADDPRYRQRRRAAHAVARDRFGWDAIAERLLQTTVPRRSEGERSSVGS